MDARSVCLEVMRIVTSRHPIPVATHIIYKELGVNSRHRLTQRQIKFLVEKGYLQRFPKYKVGLK